MNSCWLIRKSILHWLWVVIIFSACTDDDSDLEPLLIVDDFSITLEERPDDKASLGSIFIRSELEGFQFSLIGQTPENALIIDENTGIISVNDASLFDINETERIDATVEVYNGQISQQGNVTIKLSLPEETIAYFKAIALGFEFGNASEITRKWVNDMKIFVGGSPNEAMESELNKIINEINELTPESFSVEIVDDTLSSNYYLYLGSGASYARIFPSQSDYVESNWGLFSLSWNGNNELTSGHMYVDIQRASIVVQRHLLREELTQSLGLARDSFLYLNSIFQQSFTTTTRYADIDRDLIYLLYHPKMETGLSSARVDTKLREILREEW